MSEPPAFDRLADLLDELMAMGEAERAQRMDRIAAESPALHAELQSLLGFAAPAQSWFDGIEAQLQPARAAELGWHWAEGKLLGNYRLLRRLGSGGMGSVFLAERADGRFERKVAVKLLNWDGDDPAQRLRFESEQRLLGALDHPGIARLLDAGIAPEGQPYLVMEYVDGERLDAWVVRTRPELRRRLQLAIALCDAVHHAHRHLIVHGDLKPANVLVTAEGEPRLLDFGIGQRLQSDADRGVGLPAALTPAYAAPEQFLGGPVGTATDVYALGVMLFELAAGTRPDPDWLHRDETRRRLPRLADAVPALSGDLDAVVAKAMQFEAGARHVGAAQLADDLRRYLAQQPVSAHPDTAAYRARLWVRRHPWAIAASVLALAAGAAFLVHGNAQSRRIQAERDRAERVVELLVDVFTASDPAQSSGRVVSARELLDRGVPRVRSQLAGDARAQADLLSALARTYMGLGEYVSAGALLDEALDFEPAANPSHRRARLLMYRGDLDRLTGKLEPAEASLREALRLMQAQPEISGGDLALAQSKLGRTLVLRGRLDEARSLLDAALVDTRMRAGADARLLSERLNDRASVDFAAGRFDGARETLAEVVTLRRGLLADAERTSGSTDLATALNNLALAHMQLGDASAAQALFDEALAMRRALLPPQHPELAQTLSNLGLLHQSQGNLEAAERELREAMQIRRQAFANPAHPLVAQAENNLAMLLHSRSAWDEAEALLRGSLDALEQAFGAAHPLIATAETNLGNLLLDRGSPEQALPHFDRAVQLRAHLLPEAHPHRAYSLLGQGLARLDLGQWDSAGEPIETGHRLRQNLPAADPLRAEAELALALLKWRQRDVAAARSAAAAAAPGLSATTLPRPALAARLARLQAELAAK